MKKNEDIYIFILSELGRCKKLFCNFATNLFDFKMSEYSINQNIPQVTFRIITNDCFLMETSRRSKSAWPPAISRSDWPSEKKSQPRELRYSVFREETRMSPRGRKNFYRPDTKGIEDPRRSRDWKKNILFLGIELRTSPWHLIQRWIECLLLASRTQRTCSRTSRRLRI